MNKNLSPSLNRSTKLQQLLTGSHPAPGRESLLRMKPVLRKTRRENTGPGHIELLDQAMPEAICGLLSNVH